MQDFNGKLRKNYRKLWDNHLFQWRSSSRGSRGPAPRRVSYFGHCQQQSLQKGLPLPKLQGCRTFTRCPNEDRKTNIYHKHLEMFVSFFWGGVEFDRFRRNEENEESWHHSIESCDIVRYRAISCDIMRYRGIFKQGILNLLTYLTSNRRRETPAHSCNSDHLHVLKNRETAHEIATVLSWLVINYPIWGK